MKGFCSELRDGESGFILKILEEKKRSLAFETMKASDVRKPQGVELIIYLTISVFVTVNWLQTCQSCRHVWPPQIRGLKLHCMLLRSQN